MVEDQIRSRRGTKGQQASRKVGSPRKCGAEGAERAGGAAERAGGKRGGGAERVKQEEEECCKFADDDFITTRNQANVAPSEGEGESGVLDTRDGR